jgi:ankyrin repeat protein
MKPRLQRGWLSFTGLVCLLTVFLGFLTWRQVRQERLNSALIEATKQGDDKAAVRLLEQGADPNCRERPNVQISPWQMLLGMLQGNRRTNNSIAMTPLAYAAGGFNVVHPYGLILDTPDFTVAHENVTLVLALLDHGAAIDTLAGNISRTSLNFAIGNDYTATAHLLLERGAKINGQDAGDLVFDATDSHPLLADLLAHGADIDARMNNTDRTPLMLACTELSLDRVRLLLDNHASVNMKDTHGFTALDMMRAQPDAGVPADVRNASEIIRLLKAAGAKSTRK